MEHKKYDDIQAYKTSYATGFIPGDLIYIEEKIDGANASFQYNSETGELEAFSRKTKLDESNNLRGFYQWVKSLNPEDFKELPSNIRYFGEWLVPHTIPYPQNKYHQFYLFDAYNMETETYHTQDFVFQLAERLSLNTVPVLYTGPFISIEHCLSFVGQTKMGGDFGEGVVVKNMDTLSAKSRYPSYVKMVGDKFSERHACHVKIIDPEKEKARQQEQELVSSVVTRARVEKLINKMVDEGLLSEDWDAESMPIVAKNLGKAIYADCAKEAADVVSLCDNFGKVAASIGMSIARDILKEK